LLFYGSSNFGSAIFASVLGRSHWPDILLGLTVSTLLILGAWLAFAIPVAMRLQELDTIFGRCLVGRCRITAATRRKTVKGWDYLELTLAYHDGRGMRFSSVQFGTW